MTFHHFNSEHPSAVQISLFLFVITSLWIAEKFVAASATADKWQHNKVNLLFIATALPIQLLMTILVLITVSWTNHKHWGLINYIPYSHNKWVYYISLFMMLDLGEYAYHRIMHKTEALWKFHLVHHSDRHVDVTTTLREHPCETCIRSLFLMLWVFLSGPTLAVLILRQTFQSVFNILAHTEFRLPKTVNKIMGMVFITPNLHHVHHHYMLPYTNSNYGDVLSIWDRLFGTFAELDEEETVFGIDTHMNMEVTGRFVNIVKIPFQKFTRNTHQ